MKRHRAEIIGLARPQPDHQGNPDPASMRRLAVATAVVLPASVILLEEPLARAGRPLAGAFAQDVFSRVRGRLRSGGSLVLASRTPEVVQELCDEVIVLEQGSMVDRGGANGVMGAMTPRRAVRRPPGGRDPHGSLAPARDCRKGRKCTSPLLCRRSMPQRPFTRHAPHRERALEAGRRRSRRGVGGDPFRDRTSRCRGALWRQPYPPR